MMRKKYLPEPAGSGRYKKPRKHGYRNRCRHIAFNVPYSQKIQRWLPMDGINHTGGIWKHHQEMKVKQIIAFLYYIPLIVCSEAIFSFRHAVQVVKAACWFP